MNRLLIFNLVLFTGLAAVGADKKYDCSACDSLPNLKSCFLPCVEMGVGSAKWTACVDDCKHKQTRETCFTTCYPVCEQMTGAPVGPNDTRGFDNCGTCDGKVILVKDEMAEDGSRVKICQGKMKK